MQHWCFCGIPQGTISETSRTTLMPVKKVSAIFSLSWHPATTAWSTALVVPRMSTDFHRFLAVAAVFATLFQQGCVIHMTSCVSPHVPDFALKQSGKKLPNYSRVVSFSRFQACGSHSVCGSPQMHLAFP